MALRVIQPGVFTTVQDLGRPGYRAWGVPPCGAFDLPSARLANALLGNEPGAAVLEMTLTGGTFEALVPLALALAGSAITVREPAHLRRAGPVAFPLNVGERLVLGGMSDGARAYLAVRGGFATPMILGSRSIEVRLRAGEILPCQTGATPTRYVERPPRCSPDAPVRIVEGPDFAGINPACLTENVAYVVGPESDRMGLRLRGPGWSVSADPGRLSTPVAPGALQAAGGQPLLLGAACATMGGYPHVAHVITADLPRVAQVRPGDSLRFALIDPAEARRLGREARTRHDLWLRKVALAATDRPV